nr:MAG TPA: hypothetical protein [Caudoviricetes sp.]DAQ99960.1 MAG TPA: hypothetical protein [Caudoviricetes sp.]DAS87394.1 MAG TPA: hypothetical protein [Caudoviricetes sp.]
MYSFLYIVLENINNKYLYILKNILCTKDG